ncbi:hypothetical protein NMY22_g16949 [Coprinellus aureogranulatus]|nr:hypothetical protein NMY22_g16949 [Coprinellus aureogranulatus]
MEKARRAAELIDGPCITEDTALAFNALGGLPGPYIKHFMEKLGLEGLNKMLVGFEDNGAEAICTIAYSSAPGTEPMVFEGRTEGRIVQARGTKVFGWDPIFEPAESGGLTFSEMDPQEKNKMSHRYKALEKLRNYLQSQL